MKVLLVGMYFSPSTAIEKILLIIIVVIEIARGISINDIGYKIKSLTDNQDKNSNGNGIIHMDRVNKSNEEKGKENSKHN